jgi:hypothetical protein
MVRSAAHAYVPERGDAVWISLDPQAGNERAGRRPALVLSPSAYNRKVGLALFCPITDQAKGYASIGSTKSLRLLLGGCRTAEHVSQLLAELDQPVVGQLDELAQMAFSRPERHQVDRRNELGYLGLVQ